MSLVNADAEKVSICKKTLMANAEIIYLLRDCYVAMVPSGAKMKLHKGMEVKITQQLGNSFTVEVFGNLARVEGKDADALGKETADPLAGLPADASIEDQVWAMLKTVYDPEIPVNIVDLGLVYDCVIDKCVEKSAEKYQITVTMTLTAPGCGMGPAIADDAKQKLERIPGVSGTTVSIVFDPPWSREKMSDAAKLELGVF
jgi:probable FeS assembly SUF system protein SufT